MASRHGGLDSSGRHISTMVALRLSLIAMVYGNSLIGTVEASQVTCTRTTGSAAEHDIITGIGRRQEKEAC
jgi:hypothetical protein